MYIYNNFNIMIQYTGQLISCKPDVFEAWVVSSSVHFSDVRSDVKSDVRSDVRPDVRMHAAAQA